MLFEHRLSIDRMSFLYDTPLVIFRLKKAQKRRKSLIRYLLKRDWQIEKKDNLIIPWRVIRSTLEMYEDFHMNKWRAFIHPAFVAIRAQKKIHFVTNV